MAQRFSGRERQDSEFYPTPAWVTRALLPHLPCHVRLNIWEPACGEGDICRALSVHNVIGTDIRWPQTDAGIPYCSFACDFLDPKTTVESLRIDAVITNPPYGIQGRLAEQFVRKALDVVRADRGMVAMLLKIDFDSGKSRRDMFADCPAWSKKIVFTRRIVWFTPTPDANGRLNGPSENHAWYFWDWRHTGPATIAYADGKE